MLGFGNLLSCILSVSFTINGGLVGKIPFEELHFNKRVLYIDLIFGSSSCHDGEAWQTSLSKLTFVSPY